MKDTTNKKYIIGPVSTDVFNDVYKAVVTTEPDRMHPFRVATPRIAGCIATIEVIIPVGEDYSYEDRLATLYDRINASGYAEIPVTDERDNLVSSI